MPSFRTQRIVRHTPQQMFDLVADVEGYPEFLPLCESLTVRSRDTDAAGYDRITCRLTVGYGLVRETFTTQVTLKRREKLIAVRYLEGPFRKLDNNWDFREDPAGCAVQFFIDYEFRSLPLQLLMGSMFDRAFRKFAQAFEERAETVYGTPPAPA
jgi:coenzyme Q-binding protein COQ10